jgi:hypothetical protein
MTNLGGVVKQLKKEHERLTREIKGIAAALAAFGAAYGKGRGARGRMSAAGRARIAAAQKARWAKLRGNSGVKKTVAVPKKRTLSSAARKKIATAQRARWAKVRASQK